MKIYAIAKCPIYIISHSFIKSIMCSFSYNSCGSNAVSPRKNNSLEKMVNGGKKFLTFGGIKFPS